MLFDGLIYPTYVSG